MLFLAYLVLALSLINLFRMAYFLIASDYFDIKRKNNMDLFSRSYRPLVTVIVPAHNEEKTLRKNLESIVEGTYKNIEIIIANDSSTDRTPQIASSFRKKYCHLFKIKVLNLRVRGKAKALNKALIYAKGSLFMCLDADSFLTRDAIKKGVKAFRRKNLGALSSNVKIRPSKSLLNIIQRIEYLICYQMKKAETISNIQYIVGGIGSMYRRRIIRKLGSYETDTVTEDIDLSMRFIEKFGAKMFIGYEPGMVVLTEAVTSVKDLLRQRFRWKYGRYQVFLKRYRLFLNTKFSHNKRLSWFYLPYALFAELTYALEPLTLFLIFYLIIKYADLGMLIGSFLTFCFYSMIQIYGASEGYNRQEKNQLALFAPVGFIVIYILSFVEYVATIRGLFNLPKLVLNRTNSQENCAWVHVTRGVN